MTSTSNFTGTKLPSLKAGGMVGAGTGQSTTSLNVFTSQVNVPASQSSLVTLQALQTLQMVPLAVSTPQQASYSHQSTSLLHSSHSSSIGTAPSRITSSHTLSQSNTSLNPIPTVLPRLSATLSGFHLHLLMSEAVIPQCFAPITARKYKAHLTPRPSPLRPHLPARERVMGWRPAFSCPGVLGLSGSDMDRLRSIISFAWTDGTLESYGTGLLVYHVFCDNKDIAESDCCPASALLISAFVATLSGSYAGSTVAGYLYAVRAWHIVDGTIWSVKQDELDALIQAAERLQPPSSRRKKRAPYTVKILEDLVSKLDLTVALDCAVAACLTTTFYSAARLGEFTVKTLTAFDASLHVKPADISQVQDHNNLEQTAFFLPSTKSAPQAGESVFWSRQNGSLDPECLLKAHLALNKPPARSALFSFMHNGKCCPLTKQAFITRISKAFLDCNREPLQGHGIQIGSTLEYLLRNTPFDVVKVIGRWSSDAFVLYLRKHAAILAVYMQANPTVHKNFVRYTMPPVR